MDIFQGATLIHFILFFIYGWFAASIITSIKRDMLQISISAMILFAAAIALGNSIMHNTMTPFLTAKRIMEIWIFFDISLFWIFLYFACLFTFKPRFMNSIITFCAMLAITAVVSYITIKLGFFHIEQTDFGWIVLTDPSRTLLYNAAFILPTVTGAIILFLPPVWKSVFKSKQAFIIVFSVISSLIIYFIMPAKSLLDNSIDMLGFLVITSFYYSIRRYGLFEMSETQAIQSIFSNIDEYILMTNTAGIISQANDPFREKFMYGITSERNISDFFADKAAFNNITNICLKNGGIKAYAADIILPGCATVMPALITASLFRRLTIPVAIAWVIADNTAQKTLEAHLAEYGKILEAKVMEKTIELKKSYEDLKELNSDLENFTYATYHDMKEPLNSISLSLQQLRKSIGERPENEIKLMQYSIESVLRLSNMLTKIRDYIQVNNNAKFDERFSLDSCLNSALGKFAETFELTGMELSRSKLPETTGNMNYYTKIFEALLDNSIKFRNTEKIKIEIYCENSGEETIICVKDNGIGIQSEYHSKIFGLFNKLQNFSVYEGSGIGLALCRKITLLHGGRIWVESEEGKGCLFKFTVKRF